MKINNITNSTQKEMSMQEMYTFLSGDEDINCIKESSILIAWLPNISFIDVNFDTRNVSQGNYINVTFNNQEIIRLNDTGLEYFLTTL